MQAILVEGRVYPLSPLSPLLWPHTKELKNLVTLKISMNSASISIWRRTIKTANIDSELILGQADAKCLLRQTRKLRLSECKKLVHCHTDGE